MSVLLGHSRQVLSFCPFVRHARVPVIETTGCLSYATLISGPFPRHEVALDARNVTDDGSPYFYVVCQQNLSGSRVDHHHGVYGTRRLARLVFGAGAAVAA